MNCSCSATSIDVDGYFSSRTRTAAKESVCPECGDKISRGDDYLFTTLFLDGGIYNSKMCKKCESIVDQFFSEGYYCGKIKDDLESYLDASWLDDLPSTCISKLAPAAKELVCDMLQRYQEKI